MSEEPAQLITLSARAPVLTEVTVSDHLFQLVGRGVSPLEIQLPPGIYVVQFKLGSSMREVSAILRPPSQHVVVEAPPLDLASPAPLGETVSADRYKYLARERSFSVDMTTGSGGQLYLFVRAAGADRKRQDLASLFDIVIADKTGTPVARFADAAHRAFDGLSAALNLQVDPGEYLVRYPAGELGLLEQTIVVSEGWQTQVFTSSRVYVNGDQQHIGPNLADAAVFIAPIGAGFNADSPAFADAESARQALAEDIALVPEHRVREMAREKFDNPILGLYAAHLMLLRPTRDWDFLSEVLGNLRRLLGDHPDVMAFSVFPEIDLGAQDITRTVPPMLRSSWKLLVAASTRRPELIPCESYAGVVAERMWGRSAWQVWRAPTASDLAAAPAELGTRESLQAAVATLQQYTLSNIRSKGAMKFAARVVTDPGLSRIERVVLLQFVSTIQLGRQIDLSILSGGGVLPWLLSLFKSSLQRFSWADFATGSGTVPPGVQKELTPEKIARLVHVPYGAVSASLTSLARKIAARASS